MASVLALAVSVAGLLLVGGGCAEEGAERPRLLLYAGAGVRPPVAELAELFGEERGVVVECDYAGAEVLLSRIKLTRRGDLYMPGDVHYVEQAKEEGLIDSSRTACYFVPVILVRKGNPQGVETLADMLRPGLKLGLGNPEACAIGRKTDAIFEKNGISLSDVERNVVFRALTVNELGIHITAGKIDAAVVWDAVAHYYADRAEVVPIPAEGNVISTVPVAVLSFSEQKDLAREFVELVTSERGVEVFLKHGYTTQLPG